MGRWMPVSMQDTTVLLPPGIVVNAGQAAGLQACGAAEDGLTTQAESERGKENDGPPHCPNASRIGTVEIKSPLIEGASEKEFDGSMYVLQSNPPELRVLLSASADGVNVKLVGVVDLNPSTGRVEAVRRHPRAAVHGVASSPSAVGRRRPW